MTAILINNQKLWIANVGDSRAVLSRKGSAIQMSIDHEPNTERRIIENKGGFVSNLPGLLINLNFKIVSEFILSSSLVAAAISGDVARVNGQLAVSRAFGDRNLKSHLRSDPDVQPDDIDQDTELLILASDGLWKVSKTSNKLFFFLYSPSLNLNLFLN